MPRGGKKSILVRDDGEGVRPDELRLAISRHSTSKIKRLEDIFSINTLGFRGEALASIASVSKMTFTSKWRGGDHSARSIQIEGGDIVSELDAGHPEGTSVSVKYLFYKTPARLKFLKSPETETTHIVDCVTRAALVNPNVGFRLHHNGKKLLSTRAGSTIAESLKDLFGKEINSACYEIKGGGGGLEVFGMVGHPQIGRSHSRNLYIFVNGRPVKDKVLTHAVMEAYRNLLMRGRYPFVVLFINIPPSMVDVNVHPAKAEVRFSNSNIVHSAVYETVRTTLGGEPWKNVARDSSLVSREIGFNEPQATPARQQFGGSDERPKSDFRHQTSDFHKPLNDNQLYIQSSRAMEESSPVTFKKKVEAGGVPYAQMSVIGQFLGTYILCEGEGKLVLIDQHAAHERVRFEKLLLQYKEGAIPSQRLLISENFDLKHSDVEILKKYLDELEKFGLEIDFFGGNTFVVKAVPVLFKEKVSIKDLVLDLSGDILEKGRLSSLTDNLHHILATMACHSAIRAHHHLTSEEIKGLLAELEKYQFTSFCPHGRPVSVEITEPELERWFKRVV